MIHFTSDTHFDHANIIGYSNRPYPNVTDMNEGLTVNWNMAVRPEDEVFHLGDFCFGDLDRYKQILNRLNGTITLLRGNHDHKTLRGVSEIRLSNGKTVRVLDYYEIRRPSLMDVPMVVLSHYPLLRWNKGHHGSYMLHGHCHGGVNDLNTNTKRLDVGVDVHGYAPVSLETVHATLKMKAPTEHH